MTGTEMQGIVTVSRCLEDSIPADFSIIVPINQLPIIPADFESCHYFVV